MTGAQIGNVDLVKQLNSAAVYRLIDIHGPISRIQIADASHLAPASVTKITRQLLERGLIKEVDHQASTGGRRAISLTSVNEPFHAIAVRLGRDYLNISLHDLSGTTLANQGREFHYTTQQSLIEGLFNHISKAIELWQDKIENLIALGITLPGLMDPETGIVEYMPHIKVTDLPLEDLLRKKFGLEVFIGNDIRGFALAEHYFGRTQECKDSILVSVHHGTGAGIIVNGKIFFGSNRNVGEIGHIQIDPLGDKCQCGNFGCLETVAANPAIIQRVKQRLNQGYPSTLTATDELSIADICLAANQGDELAKQVIVDVGNQLGKAIAMTVNLFNPEKVIIAGDIIAASEYLLPAIRRQVANQSLPSFHQYLPIEATALADMPTISAFAMVKRAMLNGVLLQKLLGESA